MPSLTATHISNPKVVLEVSKEPISKTKEIRGILSTIKLLVANKGINLRDKSFK